MYRGIPSARRARLTMRSLTRFNNFLRWHFFPPRRRMLAPSHLFIVAAAAAVARCEYNTCIYVLIYLYAAVRRGQLGVTTTRSSLSRKQKLSREHRI